jgi:hypothetical protein
MKIAVMNYSGSVGKTIISSYLLYPRMAGAKFFAIETINMSAADLGVDEVMSLTGIILVNWLKKSYLKIMPSWILARQT